jgi:hypothetical protein
MKYLPARLPGLFEEPHISPVEAYVGALLLIANNPSRFLPRLVRLRFASARITAALLDISPTA